MFLFGTSGKEFQDYVIKSLKRNYSPKDGWEVFPQKQVRIQGIICKADFLIVNEKRNKKIVVEAKDKKSLTTNDLRQIKEYKRQAKADEAIFYLSKDTKVPSSIDEAIRKSSGISKQITRFSSTSLW